MGNRYFQGKVINLTPGPELCFQILCARTGSEIVSNGRHILVVFLQRRSPATIVPCTYMSLRGFKNNTKMNMFISSQESKKDIQISKFLPWDMSIQRCVDCVLKLMDEEEGE